MGGTISHRTRTFFSIFLLLLATVPVIVAQQSSSERAPEEAWHLFRDKEGHEVEAKVVSFSPDWRQVSIERRDGRQFDLAVTRLSLNDQQYLRDFLLNRAAPDPDSVRIDLHIISRDSPPLRAKLETPTESAVWETSEIGYQIQLTSLSRLPLVHLRLEYCLLLEDAVEILDPPPVGSPLDEARPLWRAGRQNALRYRVGSIDLPPLSFNRTREWDTATLTRDVVTPKSATRTPLEDRRAGLLVRIVASDGTVLAERSEMARAYSDLDWNTFAHRRDPAETNGLGELIEAVVSN